MSSAAASTSIPTAYGIPDRFTSLEDALAWGKFDAAVNVTPDRIHHPTTMMLVEAGKPVLCEKPLAENYFKAKEMADAAEQAGIINMVNLTYRNVAALQKARELVLAGACGEIRHVEASYLQSWLVSKFWGDWRTDPKWLWRLSRGHGSNGVLGDVGIHILDFASYGAGLDIDHVFCRLKTFDKAPGNRIGDTSSTPTTVSPWRWISATAPSASSMPAAGQPVTSMNCGCACMATEAASRWCTIWRARN